MDALRRTMLGLLRDRALDRSGLASLVEYLDHVDHVRYSVAELELALASLVTEGAIDSTSKGWRMAKAPSTKSGKKGNEQGKTKPTTTKAGTTKARSAKSSPKQPRAKAVDPEAETFAAAAEARRGNTESALVRLRALAEESAAAAGAVAELEAFRGNWQSAAAYAMKLIARPDEVYAANIFEDCAAIVRRAARELRQPKLIEEALALVPVDDGFQSISDACLRSDYYEARERAREVKRASFDKALAEAPTLPRLKGKPEVLRRHCFALAVTFAIDEEIAARWDPTFASFNFDCAVDAARAFMRLGRPAEAWAAIESRRYWPVEKSQVAPVVLLVDPVLAPLMTSARCAQIVQTPRGPEAESG